MHLADWQKIYEPLIGRQLNELAWQPLNLDTQQVVENLHRPGISFTGGVQMHFDDDRPLFLTWKQFIPYCLDAFDSYEGRWFRGTLDTVNASWDPPWSSVVGARLTGVEFFTDQYVEDHHVLAVRQIMKGEGVTTSFWIATAYDDVVGDADDLWVGAGVGPGNADQLVSLGTAGTVLRAVGS